jgi:hypothetical protein
MLLFTPPQFLEYQGFQFIKQKNEGIRAKSTMQLLSGMRNYNSQQGYGNIK